MAGPFKDGSAFYIQYIDIKNGRGQVYTKSIICMFLRAADQQKEKRVKKAG